MSDVDPVQTALEEITQDINGCIEKIAALPSGFLKEALAMVIVGVSLGTDNPLEFVRATGEFALAVAPMLLESAFKPQ